MQGCRLHSFGTHGYDIWSYRGKSCPMPLCLLLHDYRQYLFSDWPEEGKEAVDLRCHFGVLSDLVSMLPERGTMKSRRREPGNTNSGKARRSKE